MYDLKVELIHVFLKVGNRLVQLYGHLHDQVAFFHCVGFLCTAKLSFY